MHKYFVKKKSNFNVKIPVLKRLINNLICVIGKVWDGEEIPEDWKTAIIVPLYKKGDANKPSNYRGISLLSSGYKLYTEMIFGRLQKEVDEKKLLPEGQAGFRKGRSTTDNIYILNHIVQKAKMRNKRIYAMFVDLKAAFDTVDREILWEIVEEMGISAYIIERLKGIYKETKVRVRAEEGLSEEFWTTKGLRQDCILSPILFCLYIAGLEKRFEKRNIGGTVVGNKRIWSLAYADDLVIMAENREALLDMCDTLRVFLKERKLILSQEKTKVTVFNKGGNCRKEKWKWEGAELEEVKVFKYLGFVFNNQGNYKDHIKELRNKDMIAAKKTWGLGERNCKEDFKRRVMLFNYLVRSVMAYGFEVWGWAERKELERVHADYIRWTLKLEFCTPRYILYKETNIRKLSEIWSKRSMKYELEIENHGEDRLTKLCLNEKRDGKDKELYNSEREKFLNGLGISSPAIEGMK